MGGWVGVGRKYRNEIEVSRTTEFVVQDSDTKNSIYR